MIEIDKLACGCMLEWKEGKAEEWEIKRLCERHKKVTTRKGDTKNE